MNTAGVIRMLEDRDPATGEYRIPKIIYSDAYSSEMVAYADLVLPDTTYLERHDCISHAGPADFGARRGPGRDPLAGHGARPRRARVPDGAARSRRAVEAARLRRHSGHALYKDYADYIVRHERRPGIGPLAGFRGVRRRSNGQRSRQSGPAQALHRERIVLFGPYSARGAVLQARQQGLSGLRRAHGVLRPAAAGHVPALPGDRCRSSGCRRRACASLWRQRRTGSAFWTRSIRCRSGIGPSRKRRSIANASPITRSRSGRRRCIIPGVR